MCVYIHAIMYVIESVCECVQCVFTHGFLCVEECLYVLYRSGEKLHPLAVCRLLLLLDYMLFQFNTPAPLLTDQVLYRSTYIPSIYIYTNNGPHHSFYYNLSILMFFFDFLTKFLLS